MKKKFAVAFLVSLMFIGTAHAFLIPLALTAGRVAVAAFQATRPMVVNAAARTVTLYQDNKAMVVSFGAATATISAILAAILNYQPQNNGPEACARTIGSTNYSCSQPTSVSGSVADYMAGECSRVDSGSSTLLRNGVTYHTSTVTTYTNCTLTTPSYITHFYNLNEYDTSQQLPADEVMFNAYLADPSQANTDQLVSGLQQMAQSNPTDFDQIVNMMDEMTAFSGAFIGSNGQPNSIYSDGQGNVVVNGGAVSSTSVTDSGGAPHDLSLDSNSKPLVDGQGVTDLANPTAPTGTGNATSGDLGAVVDAVNGAKTQGQLDAAGIKSAIENIQTDCEKFPDSAGCQNLGDIPAEPTLTENPYDFSSLTLNPVQLWNGSSACPAPSSYSIGGQQYTLDNSPLCSFLDWMRPFVLAVAWFSCALIFVGAVRTDGVAA